MKIDARAPKGHSLYARCRRLTVEATDEAEELLLAAIFSRLGGIEMTAESVRLLKLMAKVPTGKARRRHPALDGRTP